MKKRVRTILHPQSCIILTSVYLAFLSPGAMAQATRPQIVFALGNSQSMDGTLSGAIMTGSGMYAGHPAFGSLVNSSSPVNYKVPAGFTSPSVAANDAGMAPYTVSRNSMLYDNGASRLNVAKAGIRSTLERYLNRIDFAVTTYDTADVGVYSTWAYFMAPRPPAFGFRFTNEPEPGERTITNPCIPPVGQTLSSSLLSACNNVASLYPMSKKNEFGDFHNGRRMVISDSSDDAAINDVLYENLDQLKTRSLFVASGVIEALKDNEKVDLNGLGVEPLTPYEVFTLEDYNNGGISLTYRSIRPYLGVLISNTPTNAGYVPYAPQVMHLRRGFGYYAGQQRVDAARVSQDMTDLGLQTSAAKMAEAMRNFTPLLEPETNNVHTPEIKAAATQAATAGLVRGSGDLLKKLGTNCAGQYVILLTDGLPTQSLDSKVWPPLGSAAGVGYGVYATFAGMPANAEWGLRDGTSSSLPYGTLIADTRQQTNDQAVIDAIAEIKALNDAGIKTYVVGLGAGVDSTVNPAAHAVLNAMAIAGGTAQQYPANDVPSFQSALESIAAQISTSSQIMAPLAASSMDMGSILYLSSTNSLVGDIAGHLEAYETQTGPDAVMGVADTTSALWDAGTPDKMPATRRKASIFTTAASGLQDAQGAGALVKLADMGNPSRTSDYDEAAFGWPQTAPSSCVPDIETVLAYTFNPSFNSTGDTSGAGLQFPAGIQGCSYLAGRKLNWMLGSLSPDNGALYMERPKEMPAELADVGGYASFFNVNKNRRPVVLLTSNDGILYGVDVNSGAMQWGWMPRPFVSRLSCYADFQGQRLFDGGFQVIDAPSRDEPTEAVDWATYIVGTAQGGAYHYALRMDAGRPPWSIMQPLPSRQAWGIAVQDGHSPKAQKPIIAKIGNNQIALFIVNRFSGADMSSELYEVNVATGKMQSASGRLGFVASSTMTYDASRGKLWVGDTEGGVWSIDVTGSSYDDAQGARKLGTVQPAEAINFVGAGFSKWKNTDYVWATTRHKLSVFEATSEDSKAKWTTAGGSNPKGHSTDEEVKVSGLMENSEISDAPIIGLGDDEDGEIAEVLVVPVHVPPAEDSCGLGHGYYFFFDLASGDAPRTEVIHNDEVITGNYIDAGAGSAFTPSAHRDKDGGDVFLPGTNAPVGEKTLGHVRFKRGEAGTPPGNKLIMWRRL
ncbi:PilC/PilY family type IV pilus protein [Diaphorobacter sp.]|uniref:PilC/PilY family type IV pilus protein n=1 Tax=Diaphorobacter sp. TaxID=1934310 RepID=UPI0028ADD699|nr:PilC/PilY family type IV pilus protein [Diaphorobacter sp.]